AAAPGAVPAWAGGRVPRLGVVAGRAYVLGAAPLPAGLVVVGRRLDALVGALERLPLRPALVLAAGDRLLATTLAGAPAAGWRGAGPGAITVRGEPWLARALDADADPGLRVLLSEATHRAQRRRFWLLWALSLGAAALAVVVAAWLGPRGRQPARPGAVPADRRARALDALYMAGATADDLAGTVERLLEVACGVAHTEVGGVFRLDPAGRGLVLVASRGLAPEDVERLRGRPLDASHVGGAVRAGRPVVGDLAASPLLAPGAHERAEARGYRAQLVLPIPVGEGTWGVVALLSRDTRALEPDELTLLQAVAQQVGLAVARAALLAEAREKDRRLESLARLAQHLTATLSPREVGERVVGAALDLFGPVVARLWLVDEDGEHVSPGATAGAPAAPAGAARLPLSSPLVAELAAAPAPIAIADVAEDPRTRGVEALGCEGVASLVVAPLRAGDRPVGALAVGWPARHAPAVEEIGLLQSLADYAAPALDNARLFAEEQARGAYLAAVLEINTKIGRLTPTDALLASIAEEAARLLRVDNAGFRLLEGDDLVLAGLAGSARETMLRPRLRVGESLSGKVVQTGRTLVCEIASVPDVVPEHLAADRRLGYTQFLGVPLRVGDRTTGVLTFRARRSFAAREVELAEAFAGQAAIALEHARLFREAGRQAERMAALADVGRVLSETLDFDLAARRVPESVCALLGARSSCLYRLEPESGALVAVAVADETGQVFDWSPRLPAGTGVAGLAVRERRPVATEDALADGRLTYAEDAQARVAGQSHRALLAVPLRVKDRLFGALAVSHLTGRRFGEDEIRLAQAFADQAALALENARLYTEATRRRLEAEELARLARTLTESLEVSAVGERMVESVLGPFQARSSALRLLRSDGALVLVALGGRARGALPPGHALPSGASVAGRAAAEGRAVATSDMFSDPACVVTEDMRAGMRVSGDAALLSVPLRVKGRVIGALTVGDRAGRVFSPSEIALLQAFADQAALALENARLFSLEATRRAQTATLAEIGREFAAELDPDRLLDIVIARATRLFGGHGAIYLAEGERALVPRAWTEPAPRPPLAFGQGVVGTAVELRQGLVVNDYASSVLAQPRWIELGVRRAMAQPLVLGERLLGGIVVSRDGETAAPFLAEDLEMLETFAAQAAIALQNARLYREAREHADRLAALEEVNRLVSSSLQMDEVLQSIAAAAARFFDAPHVSVWTLDAAAGRLVRSLSHGDAGVAARLRREVGLGEGAVGWVALHREPLLWVDARTDPRVVDADELLRAGLRHLTAYPIAIGDRVLGAFAVHRAVPSPVTPETASLLGSLAAQAAVAVDHARLFAETSRLLAETRALLEVVEILNSTLDSTRLLKRAAIKIAQVCRVDRCSLELWVGDRMLPLMSQYADGRRDPHLWEAFQQITARPLRDIPANVRAIETRRPVVIEDAATTDLIPRDWVELFEIKSSLVVPMIRQDQVIGVMTLERCDRPARFERWQIDLAATIAGQLALSLENTRLYTEARERLRETTTLLRVGRILSEREPTGEVMRRVAREVAHAFGADMVGAYFVDASRQQLVPLGGYHVPKDLLALLMSRPIVLTRLPDLLPAWRAGQAVASGDPREDPRFDIEWLGALPPFSVLFASANAHGEPIGALFLVWWRPGREFRPAELRLIEGVGAQVGLAIENADLARRTQAKLRETETLLSVSRALATTLDLGALTQHFLERVVAAVDADCAGVWLREGGGEWLEPVADHRVPAARREALRAVRLSLTGHAFCAEAARTRRPVASARVAEDPDSAGPLAAALEHRSQLFVPIVVKDEIVGGFGLVWFERAREFSADELLLMEAVASQAGAALENARLFEQNRRQVEELSVLHDLSRAVTGQLDRAALLAALRAHVARVLDAGHMVVALREAGEPVEIGLRITDGVEDPQPPLRYARPPGLMSVVFTTGRAIRTSDYLGECARHGVEPVALSMHLAHWLGVPMTTGDEVLGVIVLRGDGRPFGEADERLLTNIAHLAALALRSARLFEERARAYGELAAAQDQLVRTEKLRALGEMASGVAHDFNNLLASILGRAQLLLARVQAPQLRQWLQVIERASLDGAQTVRRLQEFTRIRRDQPFVAVDLNAVVRGALELTQSRWREEPQSRGVTIDVRTALGDLPLVAGDDAELREALMNLILNAVDAMPDGGTLTVTTAAADGEVVVGIGDTGMGIPEDVRERIFDPFFTTKGPVGTGLGLSMTYGIVSRHGARIEVESTEGRGTTFRLTFPAGTGLPAPEPLAPGAPQTAAGASLRCLVVDDEVPVGTMLGDVLEAGGHRAVVVTDGGEAIARFGAEPFDLVFTDLAMPRVSGWQVARAVKEMAPAVPVFLVTGFGVELSAEERRTHGVDAVLVKPLKIQQILDVVAQVARGRVQPTRTEDER
ncbi:MAG TPA: hypothetical protein DDZ42_13530, partial [Candidatus Rokubacteria bacterium]|nr:hypothetical protein [Candidatus Rokubacteria bacterium]